MSVTQCTTGASVYAPDGTLVYTNVSGATSQVPKDSNGNYYTTGSNGNVTDTLGRIPVTSSISGNTITYNLLNSQGSTSPYVVTTQTTNVSTNFGLSGESEFSGTITTVQSIKLPDGSSYQFAYDSGTTPGHYGLLTSMTVPTGGQVTYGYSNFTDANGASYYGNGTARWVSQRVTPDSATGWSYTPSVITQCTNSNIVDCQQKLTVTKPSGDSAIYTFTLNGGAWLTQKQFLDSSSNVLSTTNNCYTFVTVTNGQCSYAPTNYSNTGNVSLTWKTTTVPIPGGTNLNTTTNYTTDPAYGIIKQQLDWNFYAGTLPSTADRTISIEYVNSSPYINANLLDLPTYIEVQDKTLTQVASSTAYSYDGSSLQSATGMSSHDDAKYGTGNTVRGNVTQVRPYVVGGTYLTTSKTYDMTGQVITSTDSNGNVTTYNYNDNFYDDAGDGQNPASHSVSTPTNAYLKKITLPTVNSVTLTKTLGYYWGTGQVALSTDENSNTSYLHFNDLANRPTAASLPDGGWTRTRYSSNDTILDNYIGTTSAAPSGNSTPTCTSTSGGCRWDEAQLDGLGRPTSRVLESDPDSATTVATTYDSNGRVATVSNPYRGTQNGVETLGYDGLDRTIQVKHADGSTARTYFGAAVGGVAGAATSQLCSSSTYGFGYPILSIDEVGNKRETWTDGFGRIIETDEPGSNGNLTVGTCYTNDLNNNLLQVTSLGLTQTQKPTYTYDELSRLTSKTLPESGAMNFYYTTTGGALCSGDPKAVCRRTDARGITTIYTYDALNRLAGKTYSDSTHAVSYSYDQTSYNGLTITNGKGGRTGMSDGSGQTAWSIDAMGNVLTEERTINGQTKTVNYTYNLDGSIATITYPGGRNVTYTEGNAQRMTQAVDSTDNITYATAPVSPTVMYAPQGSPQNLVFGKTGTFAGITETRTYNNRLEITGIETTSSAGTPLNLSYSYVSGNNGNISQQTNNVTGGRTQSYTYDSLNRLLTAQTQAASGGDCWGQSFGNNGPPPTLAADALANLFYTSATQCSAPAPQFTMNSSNNNQFTGTGIGYDAAGDMTQDTAYTYTYDAENRVITASGMTNGPYCYTYDGNGMRVVKTHASGGSCTGTVTVDMLYWRSVSGDTIAETDGTGSTTNSSYNEYIFFAGRRIARSNPSSGSVYYYFVDHLGSTRLVTTATGTACYEVDYLPYGTENTPAGFTNTCSTRYRFAGYELDLETAYGTSSGNDYAFARYYNSRLGRFLSADPLDGRVDDPQTLNHYSYVRDNPLNLTDPQGLCFTNTFEDEGPDPCADLWNSLFGGGGDGGFPLNCQFSPACLKGWRANINKQPKKAPKPQARPNVADGSCPSQGAQTLASILINSNTALSTAKSLASLESQLTGNVAIVSVSGSGSFGTWEGLGLNGGVSFGLAVDPSGNVGLAITTRGGGGFTGNFGTSAGAMLNVTFTRQKSIFRMHGSSPVLGITGGIEGFGGTISASPTSGSVTLGAGMAGGLSTFGGVSNTNVIPLVCSQ